MVKVKFKKGDKVRILPSATGIMVAKDEIGKIATIIHVYSQTDIVINTSTKKYMTWNVRAKNITPVIKIGEQLEFMFMGEE